MVVGYVFAVIFPWYVHVSTVAQCLDGVISFVSVFLPSEMCFMLTAAIWVVGNFDGHVLIPTDRGAIAGVQATASERKVVCVLLGIIRLLAGIYLFFFGRGLLVGCSDLDSLFSSVGFGRICCQVEGFGTPLSLFGCVGLVVWQIILLGSWLSPIWWWGFTVLEICCIVGYDCPKELMYTYVSRSK